MDRNRQLSAAQGYMELGMFDDALAELDELGEEELATCFRLDILNAAQRWKEAAEVARAGVVRHSGCLHLFIMGAYAVRRALDSVEAALDFLMEGRLSMDEGKPGAAMFWFNLGCYHAQLGNQNDALDCVNMAVEYDDAYKVMAMSDPDLEPVREELRGALG